MNILALNGMCMLTSSGKDDIVFCDAKLRVKLCLGFNMDHVRVRLRLDESCDVSLRHDGRTDMAYRK